MTNANFNPDISFVINVPDRCKAHTNCTAGGLSDPIAPKKKFKILNEKDVMENLYSPRLHHT